MPEQTINPGANDSNSAFMNCFFYVDMGINVVFTELSGVQGEIEVTPYKEGGVNHQAHMLPGPAKFGNVVLKRGMASDNGFFEWFSKIVSGTVERRDVTITMYRNNGKPLHAWKLEKAFPCKWSAPNFNAKEGVIAIETVELAHDGLTLLPLGDNA
jgi:phage tail-like protein